MMEKRAIKSATVTYFDEYNYGAVLQAYALQHFLKARGFQNQIINYSTRNEGLYDRPPRKMDRAWLYYCKKNLITLLNASKLKQKRIRFDRFIEEHLERTPRYSSFDELVSNPPDVDVLFAGSDQIWNIKNNLRKDFFLQFGDPGIKRVSYAASMGLCSFSEEKRKMLLDAVSAFDLVSVREREAEQYLSQGGIPADTVPDPTLLIDAREWEPLAAPPAVKGKYIFCYPLLFHKDIDRALLELKRLTGYQVVTLMPNPECRFYADIPVLDAGPAEFLGLIQNAEFVVTSSFHGTAFSLIFQKEFFAFNSAETKGRITSLLEATNLLSRFNAEEVSIKEPIDYLSVGAVLQSEVEKAGQFIKKVEGLL